MGAQRLGVKWVRRLSRNTGLDVVAGWSYGSYLHGFVTSDHEHCWYDMKTGEYGPSTNGCYTSCAERFPDKPPA